MMLVSVQCVMNGLSVMTDHEVVSSLPQCVLDADSVSKSSWEQLFKTVKLIGKSINIAAASRGPVTLVLDRVGLDCFFVQSFTLSVMQQSLRFLLEPGLII